MDSSRLHPLATPECLAVRINRQLYCGNSQMQHLGYCLTFQILLCACPRSPAQDGLPHLRRKWSSLDLSTGWMLCLRALFSPCNVPGE